LFFEARFEVASGDEAFTKIDATVLLTNSNIILDLDLEWLSFNSLKAVKSARSLLFGARSHVECGDKALTVIDSAVLFTDTNVLRDLDSTLGALALEAI
jgi:hypothetical protein